MFDAEYVRVWSFPGPEVTAREVDALCPLLPSPPARVLDVACGNGRHAIELTRRGYEVVGVDLSEAILERGRRAVAEAGVPVELRQGDMRELDLHGFDAVVILGNSFGYHDDSGNAEALARIAGAVRSRGVVIMELLNRDRILANYRSSAEHISADGTVVRLISSFDAIQGVNTVIHRWQRPDGRPLERRTAQRLYTPSELAALCRQAELIPEAWLDGYTGRPFDIDVPRLVLAARREGRRLPAINDERM